MATNNNSTSALFPHLCVDDDFSLMHVGTEMFSILVFSHIFNLLLKPLGQSGPISHMLAGMVLGPSCLSRITFLKENILQDSGKIYNQTVATFSRVIFMFLFGLQMDVPYLLRTYKLASWVAYSGVMVCSILALAFSPVLYHETQAQGNGIRFGLIMIMMLSSTSSPAVIKIASELRFDMSDVGRLAIFSSLINDISVLVGLSLMTTWGSETSNFWTMFKIGLLCSLLLVAAIFLNILIVKYLNQMNPHRKYLRNIEAVSLLLYIMCLAMYTELSGYNSIITCFFLGLFFPREGKTYRTLVHKLDYPTHNFILPIYFAYTGFQADLKHATDLRSISIILLVVFLSIVGKLGGTYAASLHLKMSPRDGVILGLLLNTKGHVDVMIISLASERHRWTVQIFNLYIITVAINTIIVGPFLAYLGRGERRAIAFKHSGLEWQSPGNELRIIACVHAPRHVSTMVRLVAATTGTPNSSSSFGSLKSPVTTYLMHLVELTDKSSNDLLYHQQDLEEDDDDYGGNDELEINEYIDSFVADTRLPIHQKKTVAPFTTMHDDLCDTGRHLRAQMILLPFHKHQRIDGKMENSKMGIRTTNQKLLRSAPCSIGILVDRGFSPIQVSESDNRHQVAILFFGGPDDREALAYGSYMIMHSNLKVTVFRFLPATKREQQTGINMESNEEEEVLMEIMSPETEKDADEGFLTDFYNRYVASMEVNYEEKCVENGKETMSFLKSMKDRYSLFIVGKGRGTSPLTTGMSDWEECPELGVVGDVLASSDFVVTGSVLVIQQHKSLKNELLDCESMR